MLVLLYFTISLLSAFLLFAIQPLAAKVALPILGGAPFVWNGCMLFFQAVLLSGYIYAHLIGHQPLRRQTLAHITLLTVAVLIFPVAFAHPASINPTLYPMGWLLGMLALNIGLPFFAISATAPLIQRWFSATSHARASNPYFLYAASNLGSFGALFCYLFVIEPNLPLTGQLHWLHAGYALLLVLFAAAAFPLWQRAVALPSNHQVPETGSFSVEKTQILLWLVISFIPSSLLYGITTYITTDVASVPLLWVIPLALYLLSFVLVFADRPIGIKFCRFLHVPLAAAMAILSQWNVTFSLVLALVHLSVFFIIALSCHGKLAASRPPAYYLTRFYLWVALGGVLGGVFNIFVAPHLFTSVLEYPLMLLASMIACLPFQKDMLRRFLKTASEPWVLILEAVAVLYIDNRFDQILTGWLGLKYHFYSVVLWGGILGVLALFYLQSLKRTAQAIAVAIGLYVATAILFEKPVGLLFAERNLFGVSRVWEKFDGQGAYHLLKHGTTDHGVQSLDEEQRLKPLSYYTPLLQVFRSLDARSAQRPVAVLGLGAGTIACYGKSKQLFDIFEIDPIMAKVAGDPELFTYLRDCPPVKKIHMGDGRLGIASQEDGKYGIIIADAFTSDAIPIHLVTLESVTTYFSKIDRGGLVAFNTSNRHLDISPVLSAIARRLGAKAYQQIRQPERITWAEYSASWAVLTRNEEAGRKLLKDGWTEIPPAGDDYLWRDDFSNIAKVIKPPQ